MVELVYKDQHKMISISICCFLVCFIVGMDGIKLTTITFLLLFNSLCEHSHDKIGCSWIRSQRWTHNVCGSMLKARMRIIGAIAADCGSQCFTKYTNTFVSSTSSCHFNGCTFAHYMHHIQWTIRLRSRSTHIITIFQK